MFRGLSVIAIVIGIALALPVVSVLASFLYDASDTWQHLMATALPRYIANTLLLLLAVSAGVMSMGVVSAWLVTSCRFPGRDVLQWALMLPLAMPAYVMAYAYTDWLQFTFPGIRSLWGAAAMLSLALYPYVYLVARTAFHEISRSAIEAARLAGYGAWGAFVRVAVPLARPAIVAGASLALMETLADFGTVSYFALEVFTTGIFKAWLSMGDSVAAGQLSACLLAFVVVMLSIERASRRRAAYAASGAKPLPPQRLRGARAGLALAACAAPVIFGFALPAALLAQLAWGEKTAYLGARMMALVGNSFGIAGLTALIAVALGLAMAYAARLTRSGLVRGVNRAGASATRCPARSSRSACWCRSASWTTRSPPGSNR
jgi:iron(III) transport system permease protein